MLYQRPDNSAQEDMKYHEYVLEKIKRGQQSIADGQRYTSEEAKARLSRRLLNSIRQCPENQK